nr:MAG TPA: hypothetical protein [Caudoviricetes sp.]
MMSFISAANSSSLQSSSPALNVLRRLKTISSTDKPRTFSFLISSMTFSGSLSILISYEK